MRSEQKSSVQAGCPDCPPRPGVNAAKKQAASRQCGCSAGGLVADPNRSAIAISTYPRPSALSVALSASDAWATSVAPFPAGEESSPTAPAGRNTSRNVRIRLACQWRTGSNRGTGDLTGWPWSARRSRTNPDIAAMAGRAKRSPNLADRRCWLRNATPGRGYNKSDRAQESDCPQMGREDHVFAIVATEVNCNATCPSPSCQASCTSLFCASGVEC
jgi:hypothetical protein